MTPLSGEVRESLAVGTEGERPLVDGLVLRAGFAVQNDEPLAAVLRDIRKALAVGAENRRAVVWVHVRSIRGAIDHDAECGRVALPRHECEAGAVVVEAEGAAPAARAAPDLAPKRPLAAVHDRQVLPVDRRNVGDVPAIPAEGEVADPPIVLLVLAVDRGVGRCLVLRMDDDGEPLAVGADADAVLGPRRRVVGNDELLGFDPSRRFGKRRLRGCLARRRRRSLGSARRRKQDRARTRLANGIGRHSGIGLLRWRRRPLGESACSQKEGSGQQDDRDTTTDG